MKDKRNRRPPVYKYTKIEYIPSIISNGVYVGNITEMNDPYEYKDIVNTDNYYLCCLTRSNNAKLMWAHYANSHKGCTVQIELPVGYGQEDCLLKQVNYKTKYINRSAMTSSEIVASLYDKDKKWHAELEVRGVLDINNYDTTIWSVIETSDGKKRVYYKCKIKSISFGCCSDVNSQEYLKAIYSIREYNKTVPKKDRIVVHKYSMKNDKYSFVQDKCYCFEKECETKLFQSITSIIEETHSDYMACMQSVNWNLRDVSWISGDGYLIQEVLRKQDGIEANHYFEAWRIKDWKYVDHKDNDPDDVFRIGDGLNENVEILHSVGKKGSVTFEPRLYWIDKNDDLFKIVDSWEHSVRDAGTLKSVSYTNDFANKLIDKPRLFREAFTHVWDLENEEKIVELFTDYCIHQWKRGEEHLVCAFLEDSETNYFVKHPKIKEEILCNFKKEYQ